MVMLQYKGGAKGSRGNQYTITWKEPPSSLCPWPKESHLSMPEIREK